MDENMEVQSEWKITDDDAAEWAVCKIAETRNDCERLVKIAENKIAALQAEIEKLKDRCEAKTSTLEFKLAEYFRSVPHKKTATTESYKLLSGSLTVKKAHKKPVVDDEKLVEWLAANGYTDYIKTMQTAAWGDFKKALDLSGETVTVKETGEVVDGVTFEDVPEKFEVKLKKEDE